MVPRRQATAAFTAGQARRVVQSVLSERVMSRLLVIWALVGAVWGLPFGCFQSASIGELHWTPEQPALEVGPVDFTTQHVVTAGSATAYRVEGFGGTRLRLETDGDELTHLYVEGPIGPDEDELAVGKAPVVAEAWGVGARLETTLGRGIYRVIAGSDRGARHLLLQASCDGECARGQLDPVDLLSVASGTARADMLSLIAEQLSGAVSDAATGQLAAQLFASVKTPSLLTRFPTIALRDPSARPTLDCGYSRRGDASGAVQAPMTGSLSSLLGDCEPTPPPVRRLPSELSLPDPSVFQQGVYTDRSFTRCQVAHSQRLAKLLNALSDENGSRVDYRGQGYDTVVSLVRALLDAGHSVEVRNLRSYASFGGFRWDGYDVRWPIWLSTGLTTHDGQPIDAPLGVSRQAWTVKGPDVDARVTFIVDGPVVQFVADTEATAAWAGARASDVGRSNVEGPDRILATLAFSARYRKRILSDAKTSGLVAGYQAGGNDPNAFVEYATHGTITTFPLRRAAVLDVANRLDPVYFDELDQIFRALPHDADVPPAREDGLRRLLAMSPHEVNSPLLPDESFRAQLESVSQEVLGY